MSNLAAFVREKAAPAFLLILIMFIGGLIGSMISLATVDNLGLKGDAGRIATAAESIPKSIHAHSTAISSRLDNLLAKIDAHSAIVRKTCPDCELRNDDLVTAFDALTGTFESLIEIARKEVRYREDLIQDKIRRVLHDEIKKSRK